MIKEVRRMQSYEVIVRNELYNLSKVTHIIYMNIFGVIFKLVIEIILNEDILL